MEYTILNSNIGYNNNLIVSKLFIFENFIAKFSTLSTTNLSLYLLIISAGGLVFYGTWVGISKIISLKAKNDECCCGGGCSCCCDHQKAELPSDLYAVNEPIEGQAEGQGQIAGQGEGQSQTEGEEQGEDQGIGRLGGKPIFGPVRPPAQRPIYLEPYNEAEFCCCGKQCSCPSGHEIAHKPEATTLSTPNHSYGNDISTSYNWKYTGKKGSHLKADVPLAWGLYFQDGATPSFEGIVDLHNRIMFYLVVILFGVSWVMLSIMWNFNKSENKLVYRYLNHGTLIELIWTVGPALVLVAIAFPSFKLLYLMDEVIDPAMTVKVTGHQWYWEYEYADFLNEENETINFDSYMKDEASLEEGELRMLEVDNAVVLPIDTHIRFIITGADVLHDWAVPALALKVDAAPGRLNQASVIIERTGYFYGQCSEICGVLHSSMPIKIEAVEVEKFFSWLLEQ
jgi:cytochrome c oxidase subunit 2